MNKTLTSAEVGSEGYYYILIVLCAICIRNKASKLGSTIYHYEKTNYVLEMIPA